MYIFPLLPLVGIWALMEINLTVTTQVLIEMYFVLLSLGMYLLTDVEYT